MNPDALLVLFPLGAALAAIAVPGNRERPLILPFLGALHFFLATRAIALRAGEASGAMLQMDALGGVVLLVVSGLYFLCSIYAVGYLRHRIERENRSFCACLCLFLGLTSLVCLAQHLALLWVAVEGTALSTALLIYFKRSAHSVEAAWKYLMLSSVGIAIALLGSFFLSYAAYLGTRQSSLLFVDLVAGAAQFSAPWVRAAFVFLLVGYGTKMGLAPLHAWKPDTYGEAPGVVGALLAGGLTSCAFLALMRVYRVVDAAGQGPYARRLLVVMGLASVALAAVFMARQRDFKRMLAYSSVEHMGLLVLGVGIGGAGVFAALLHVFGNAMAKGVVFLSAANIHRAYGSKSLDDVSGAMRRLPVSGWLFLAGFFALTGSPPFGPFLSEIYIATAAVGSGQLVTAGLLLAGLGTIFVGMGAAVLSVLQGEPRADVPVAYRDGLLQTVPIGIAMAVVLMLGIWIPSPVHELLNDAALLLEAAP